MSLAINTQRGVPYDPSASASFRERKASEQARQAAREKRAQRNRAYARQLDEIEACYRERRRG